METPGPWQLWLWMLGWPAALAVLAHIWPSRVRGLRQALSLAGWGGVLVALGAAALRPVPPLVVWGWGGAEAPLLGVVLRADGLGLGLALACTAVGLAGQALAGRGGGGGGGLVLLVGMLLGLLGGNAFTYALGLLLWEVALGAMALGRADAEERWEGGFPGGLAIVWGLLALAPAGMALSFHGEVWSGAFLAAATLAGLWISGVFPAVGGQVAATCLPAGTRALAWVARSALGLTLVGHALTLGEVPGWDAVFPLLLVGGLLAAVWAAGGRGPGLAATRAVLLALATWGAKGVGMWLPWAVLGFGLGLLLLTLEVVASAEAGTRLLDPAWARALGLLTLAGLPLTPAFAAPEALTSSVAALWWFGLVNALSLTPLVWSDRGPFWRLPRPGWRETLAAAVLVALGVAALRMGPTAEVAEASLASASALGGLAGAAALGWLRRQTSRGERLARAAARAADPAAWARHLDGVLAPAAHGVRWGLALWEGRPAFLWSALVVLVAALVLRG